ncbi:Na+/H+ antiporter NhaC family protein [Biostraticola tofi]|uniref:Na+/H+ antiporter family protein n=1 Tax=Biostraticola tofi TaxID=466109 RepID=A0A4R3YVT0_9GAMM|nr:Na+/H+ antiporter NhaC family protein [Biostraticola tofi]TCV96761.1 Na+/H+ antiporter family protein [Biostraticola tofi]
MDWLHISRICAILFIFLLFSGLMMARKMPAILALPVMAVLMPLVAGVPVFSADKGTFTIADNVLTQGSLRLGATIVALIFGAWFGEVLKKVGVTEALVRKAAELSGDKPLTMAIVFFIIGTVIFSSSDGLGMVILVGSIVIPILLTAGLSPLTSCIVLLACHALGSLFAVSGWALMHDLYGIPIADMARYAMLFAIPAAIVYLAMVIWLVKRDVIVRKAWSMPVADKRHKRKQVNAIALISPLVPVVIIFLFRIDVVPAITLSLIICLLLALPKRPTHILVSSLVEGIQNVAGAIGLMVGIGILLNAVTAPQVTLVLKPLIESIIPTSPLAYILFFSLLSPLALYRGPLNSYGLGSGLGVLMLGGGLSPLATMLALRSASLVQGLSDPTNTHNVWSSDFAKVDVNEILRKTLPWAMVAVLISMVMAGYIAF